MGEDIECVDGVRTIIHMPSGERYYLLAFPYAVDGDHFFIKFPFENRVENQKERDSLEEIFRVVNDHIKEIHLSHAAEIAELLDEIEEMAKSYCTAETCPFREANESEEAESEYEQSTGR